MDKPTFLMIVVFSFVFKCNGYPVIFPQQRPLPWSFGDLIESTGFFPIEINVPDTINSFTTGMSNLFSRIPFINRWNNLNTPRIYILVPAQNLNQDMYPMNNYENNIMFYQMPQEPGNPGSMVPLNYIRDTQNPMFKLPCDNPPDKNKQTPDQMAVEHKNIFMQMLSNSDNKNVQKQNTRNKITANGDDKKANENRLTSTAVDKNSGMPIDDRYMETVTAAQEHLNDIASSYYLINNGLYVPNQYGYSLYYPHLTQRGVPNLAYNEDGKIINSGVISYP